MCLIESVDEGWNGSDENPPSPNPSQTTLDLVEVDGS